MRACLLLPLPLLLAACDTTAGKWARDAGEYIPGVGERCQEWQCLSVEEWDDWMEGTPEPEPVQQPLPDAASPLPDHQLGSPEVNGMNPPPPGTPAPHEKPPVPEAPREEKEQQADPKTLKPLLPEVKVEPPQGRKSFPDPGYSF